MLRFSVLKPEAPSVDKKQPQPRPEDKGKRGFTVQFLLYHKFLCADCGDTQYHEE